MGGVPLLMSVLQDDRDDVDLMRGALECFVHAMRQPQGLDAHGTNWSPALVRSMPLSPWGQSLGGIQEEGHPYQQLLKPYPTGQMPSTAQAIESQVRAWWL